MGSRRFLGEDVCDVCRDVHPAGGACRHRLHEQFGEFEICMLFVGDPAEDYHHTHCDGTCARASAAAWSLATSRWPSITPRGASYYKRSGRLAFGVPGCVHNVSWDVGAPVVNVHPSDGAAWDAFRATCVVELPAGEGTARDG